MKKFRAKIDTPWCKKGEIYVAHTYAFDRKTFSPKDIPFGYECVDHPEDYPDLFEPVEEKSNYEKWSEILRPYIKKITSAAVESWKRMPSKFYEEALDIEIRSLNIFLSERLDADKICKEVCGEG